MQDQQIKIPVEFKDLLDALPDRVGIKSTTELLNAIISDIATNSTVDRLVDLIFEPVEIPKKQKNGNEVLQVYWRDKCWHFLEAVHQGRKLVRRRTRNSAADLNDRPPAPSKDRLSKKCIFCELVTLWLCANPTKYHLDDDDRKYLSYAVEAATRMLGLPYVAQKPTHNVTGDPNTPLMQINRDIVDPRSDPGVTGPLPDGTKPK